MIFTLAAKELKTLFGSPLAWGVLAVLQALLAYVFLGQLDAYLSIQPRLTQLANPPGVTEMVAVPLFGIAALVLLMATPLLSMRLIAGEKQDRTLAFLLSAPLSLTEIVLGKFLGLLAFLAAVAALPALMALSLYAGGGLDFGLVLSNFIGLLLLAAAFAALGLFLSSLTASPTLAGFTSLGAFLGLWVVNMAVTDPGSVLHTLSLLKHFEGFNRGLVDSADVAYFLVFAALFLAFTVRRLDNQRLGG